MNVHPNDLRIFRNESLSTPRWLLRPQGYEESFGDQLFIFHDFHENNAFWMSTLAREPEIFSSNWARTKNEHIFNSWKNFEGISHILMTLQVSRKMIFGLNFWHVFRKSRQMLDMSLSAATESASHYLKNENN